MYKSLIYHITLESLPSHWLNKINRINVMSIDVEPVYIDYEMCCKYNKNVCFVLRCYDKKVMYNILIMKHCYNLIMYRTVWCDLLSFDMGESQYFANIYVDPLIKTDSDMIWRFLHGAISTSRYLFQCKFKQSPYCLYCDNVTEDLMHMFIECRRLIELFALLDVLAREILCHIKTSPFHWFITGVPLSKKKSNDSSTSIGQLDRCSC